jgi:hypothetical protein
MKVQVNVFSVWRQSNIKFYKAKIQRFYYVLINE